MDGHVPMACEVPHSFGIWNAFNHLDILAEDDGSGGVDADVDVVVQSVRKEACSINNKTSCSAQGSHI